MDMQKSLLTFPCDFPIKVMGGKRDGFADAIVGIVLRHAPDLDVSQVEMRASSGGKYLSLTCVINAVSMAQLDNLYQELTAQEWVEVVL